jgi:hypothetical protein
MTSIRFSAASTASNATQITVSLGGTPNVGDLVLVWLGLSNQIVVQPPGYNGTGQWFKANGLQGPSSKTALHQYYHTWNASDSGTSAVFTFSPAPSLGVGDTDLSTASGVAVAVVVSAGPAVLDTAPQGLLQPATAVPLPLTKRSSSSAFTGAYSASGGSWSATDGAVVVTATLGSQVLTVFDKLSSLAAGYSPTFSQTVTGDLMIAGFTLSDSGPQVYNPPVIQESPVANDDPLLLRYKLGRYYTVLNNSGVFSAQRYLSTDQVNAATQVFVNNAPVTATDRTNLLNAGVGGDFRALS